MSGTLSSVATIMAGNAVELNGELLSAAADALKTLGAETGPVRWLSDGEAADLPFTDVSTDAADAAIRHLIDDAAIDVIAQSADLRRKQILVADMDSTIVTSETLDDLAALAGIGDEIAAITKRAMAGELDFEEALKARVSKLAGLPKKKLKEAYERVELTPGAATLIKTMSKNGAYTALVSGGFTYFTKRVRDRLGFDMHLANKFVIKGGKLTGEVEEPVLTRQTKIDTLVTLARDRGLALSQTATVGDGANDLDMTMAAGLGVAYRGKPVLRDAAQAKLDHMDLRGLLFAQGYSVTEFVV